MIALDLLPALVALADSGTLRAAGQRLGITAPGVHRQVAQLTRQAGMPLYARNGNRLVLTPAGERLAALGREVARASMAAMAAMADLHGPKIGGGEPADPAGDGEPADHMGFERVTACQ